MGGGFPSAQVNNPVSPFSMQTIISCILAIKDCIRRAQDVIFWSGLATDIKEMVSHCDVCSNFMCTQQKESAEGVFLQSSSVSWKS